MSSLERPTTDQIDAESVEAEFKLEADLGESVASELFEIGHPGVREIRVVSTEPEGCLLTVKSVKQGPVESEAFYNRVRDLISSARTRITQESLLFRGFRKSQVPSEL